MKIFPVILLLIAGNSLPLYGAVTMPAIFSDHMVLQQDSKVPVWGWADPDEAVTVTIGNTTLKTKADVKGNWRVNFAPLPAASAPQTVTVTGKNTLTFQDVLLGDVWLASGQSNMGLPLNDVTGGWELVRKGKIEDNQLRIFAITRYTPTTPQRDILPPTAAQPLSGKWLIGDNSTLGGFSGCAYYFGVELRKTIKHPIGLIQTTWGGSSAQAWTSLESLSEKYVSAQKTFVAAYPAAKAKFDAEQAVYLPLAQKWKDEVSAPYEAALAKWQKEASQAQAAGQPAPQKPVLASPEPKKPVDPDQSPGTPASLFNGMVSPIVPFALKGTIWYQGESNSADDYTDVFRALITDWRSKWGQGDFPFVFVQLPNFAGFDGTGRGNNWTRIRECQTKALALPNTAMAVTIDIGERNNIHPRDKQDVAHRLALAALPVAYGQSLLSSGPVYDSMKVEGNKIRLKFKSIGTGLIYGKSPILRADPTELTGFTIAGADKQWKPGTAVIEGDSVVVSAADLAAPVAVRYAWEEYPTCNLYNKEMLPAAPFRTDAW